MKEDKRFLEYDEQIHKLNNDKLISCENDIERETLIRKGYFNLINGYKDPFVARKDDFGKHVYFPEVSLNDISALKDFDDSLSIIFIKICKKIEEEIRTLSGHAFGIVNKDKSEWYELESYSEKKETGKIVGLISKLYGDIVSNNKKDYLNYYIAEHKFVPVWILTKVIRFSNLISFIEFSKDEVAFSLCELYGFKEDNSGYYNKKLLWSALHLIREIRNACAHNERIYNYLSKNKRRKEYYSAELDRIKETKSYSQEKDKKLFDLIVYFKYFLKKEEYDDFIFEIVSELNLLEERVNEETFKNIVSKIGLKDKKDLERLKDLKRNYELDYLKFEDNIKKLIAKE